MERKALMTSIRKERENKIFTTIDGTAVRARQKSSTFSGLMKTGFTNAVSPTLLVVVHSIV